MFKISRILMIVGAVALLWVFWWLTFSDAGRGGIAGHGNSPSHMPSSDVSSKPVLDKNLPDNGLTGNSPSTVVASNPSKTESSSSESASVLYEILESQGDSPDSKMFLKFSRLMQKCWIQGLMVTAERHQESDRQQGGGSLSESISNWSGVQGCEGLPTEAAAVHDKWLSTIAKSGSPEARVAFGSQMLWVRDPQQVYRDAARYAAFKEQTEDYLKPLVAVGDVAALEASASLRMNPHWRQPDPASAWAYLMAAAWKSSNTRRIQAAEQLLHKMVPLDQQERANLLSVQINGGMYVE